MKRLAFALLLASSTAAAANNPPPTPQELVTGGSATATGGNARQHQHQAQAQKQHQHQQQSVSVTNTVSQPAATTTGSGGASGFGSGHNDARAPDVVLPPVGGGGSDCPVVGFSAGGSGLGGGGGFGPGWISSRCDHRMYARLIFELTGDREKAMRYLASVEPDVRDFVKSEPHAVELPPTQPEQPMHTVRPQWCETASLDEKLRHYRDCL